MQHISKTQIILGFLIITFLSIFYTLTSLYPIHGDDWTYRFIFNQKELVQNLSDVFSSQKEHWCTWGGRFIAHSLVQSFLLIDKSIFNILNTACYAIGCALIARFSFKNHFLRNWLLVLLSLWLIMPSPGKTMFWLTGSFNYLWPSFFTISFLILLFTQNTKLTYFAIPVGIIAGNGHESISLGISVTLILYSIISTKKSKLFYIAIACYIIGALSNFLAPGNYVRMASTAGAETLGGVDYLQKYIKHLLKIGYRLTFNWSDLGVQCCTCLWLLASYYFLKYRKTTRNSTKNILLLCLISGTICSLGLNLISGTAYARSVYGFCFLAYLSFMFAIGNFLKENSRFYYFFLLLTTIANIIFIPAAYKHIKLFNINVQQAIQCSQNGHHIACAHPESECLQNSRFAGFGLSPCLLDNWNFEDLYCCAISLLNKQDFLTIYSNKSYISRQKENHSFQLNNKLNMIKLPSRPKHVTENLSYKPLSSDASLFTKLNHKILQQKKPEKLSFLIKHDGYYYLCWHSELYNGTFTITYNDKTFVLTIY